MGTYLNLDNERFQEILRSEYVDKTGLIDIKRFREAIIGKKGAAYGKDSGDRASGF